MGSVQLTSLVSSIRVMNDILMAYGTLLGYKASQAKSIIIAAQIAVKVKQEIRAFNNAV